jgi:hypothetical protein
VEHTLASLPAQHVLFGSVGDLNQLKYQFSCPFLLPGKGLASFLLVLGPNLGS